jgi:hypothetical protein
MTGGGIIMTAIFSGSAPRNGWAEPKVSGRTFGWSEATAQRRVNAKCARASTQLRASTYIDDAARWPWCASARTFHFSPLLPVPRRRAPDAADGARLRRALALPGRAVAAAGAARRARAVAIADEITVAITVDLLHFV